MEINLSNLLVKQQELDGRINTLHNVSHASTKDERFVALLVEIGELANATRAFKYWSLKPSEARSILLDEYADGLHFFLSLALVFDYAVDEVSYKIGENSQEFIVKTILDVYAKINEFRQKETIECYFVALKSFLVLGSALQFTPDDIINAYGVKLLENYKRQDTKYQKEGKNG